MSDRIDPIDPKLRQLFDREAAEPFTNDAMRSRILQGVNAAISGGGNGGSDPEVPDSGNAGPSAPSTPSAGTASLLAKPLGSVVGLGAMGAIFAGGVVVGTQVAPQPTLPPPPPAIVQPIKTIETIETTETPETIEAPEPPAEARGLKPEAPKQRPKAEAKPKLSALAEEERLIERARTALARNYHDDALAALDDHARRFPTGALAADRDGLRALVLSRAGRTEEAKRAAEKYLSDHPQGTLAPSVERILEK